MVTNAPPQTIFALTWIPSMVFARGSGRRPELKFRITWHCGDCNGLEESQERPCKYSMAFSVNGVLLYLSLGQVLMILPAASRL
eukprot:474408-Amphidinium_carterae.1